MDLKNRGQRMRISAFLLITAALTAPSIAQNIEHYALPLSMPADRAEDSYAIYSKLLKSGPIEWRSVKRSQWLVEDTTTAESLTFPCQPLAGSHQMNPHTAVQAPFDRQEEWLQLLADYDQHCHDVIQLEQSSFRTELPVRLLNAADQQKFRETLQNPPAIFADAAGLHQFSEVYFNPGHTLALVQQGMWCGYLCGNWTWVVLERKNNHWKILPWTRGSIVA
ncbi:MAG: hypothetical protein P4L03_07330 [Terracidiphilus sp.]|nr:hypothetical protein [Terracidiphilus sp.]